MLDSFKGRSEGLESFSAHQVFLGIYPRKNQKDQHLSHKIQINKIFELVMKDLYYW